MQMEHEWDGSPLRAYLLRDYWTPDGGLCLLAGFDYTARIEGAPFQPQSMHTLSPITFQGHYGQEADEVEDLLTRMNSDLDELRSIWAGCKRDSEAEDHSPTFFIEWASSKGFRPDWLDWAIERKLYIPKQEADQTSLSDFDKTSIACPPNAAKDASKGAAPATETKEQRQDRRLASCEAARLVMPKSCRGRLPDGVGIVAKDEGVTQQAFSNDVKAALSRRELSAKNPTEKRVKSRTCIERSRLIQLQQGIGQFLQATVSSSVEPLKG